MKHIIFLSAAFLFIAGILSTPSRAADVGGYALSEVSVTNTEDAFIDWNTPGSEQHQYDAQFIQQIFIEGTRDGVSPALTGSRPARVEVEIVEFDILSDIEKLFCCAQNEVSAWFTLRDLETGEVVIPRTFINLEHVGRGGVLTWISQADGTDQIFRLIELISKKTRNWVADPT